MEPEQFKQIIELIQSTGDDAKLVAIVYILASTLPTILIGGAWTVIGGAVVVKVIGLFKDVIYDERVLAAAGWTFWTKDRYDFICKAISEAKERGEG
jgi:hypothetical protein